MSKWLRGTSKNDTLVGTTRNDFIDGKAGNDILTGAAGYDVIHGGGGFDIARFSGSFLDYAIVGNRHIAGILDLRSGSPDGADALLSVEALEFADRTLYLDGRNNAPYALADAVSTPEDEPLVIPLKTLLRNDGDFDGDALTLAAVGTPAHGAAIVSGGRLVYTPAANFNGTDTFSYTIRDPAGAQSTANVTVQVRSVNDAPIAQPDRGVTDEDHAVTIAVLANDRDVDAGATLAVLSVDATSARGATVRAEPNGSLTYDPRGAAQLQGLDTGHQVDDTFRYTVTDEHGATQNAVVTIVVLGRNDINGVAHDGYLSGATVFADIDGDRQRDAGEASGLTDASGRFSLGGPLAPLVLTGGIDTATRLPFTGQLSAPAGFSVVSPLTTLVAALQRSGLTVDAAEQRVLAAFGLSPAIDLASFDPLAQTVAGNPAAGAAFRATALIQNAASLTASLAAGLHGTSVASESARFFDALGVAINNLAPGAVLNLASSAGVAAVVNGAIPGVSAVNANGAAAIISAANAAAAQQTGEGSALLANIARVATVAQGAAADALLAAGAGSTPMATAIAAFTGSNLQAAIAAAEGQLGDVDGPAVQNAPIARDDRFTVIEDVALTLTRSQLVLNDVDYDGQALLTSVVTGPRFGTLSSASGDFVYRPNANFNGSDSFTYRVSDGALSSDIATVRLDVAPVPDAPVAVNDSVATNEDTPLRISVSALLANDTDVDTGDTRTLVSVASGIGGTVSLVGGFVTFTPAAGFNGAGSFSYTVRDAAGLRSSASVSVTVRPVNDAPIARDDSHSTTEDTIYSIQDRVLLLNDTDPDGDPLTLVSVGSAIHGQVSLVNGFARFVPEANFTGAAGYSYVVRDAGGAQSTGRVTITYTPVNDSPVNVVPAAQSVNEDTALTISGIRIADVDSATLQILLSVNHGTLSLSARGGLAFTQGDGASDPLMRFTGTLASVNAALASVVYRPAANYNGRDTLLINTNDRSTENVGIDTDRIAITVNPVNDVPVAVQDVRMVRQLGSLQASSVLFNDSDADGNPLTAVLVQAPDKGALSLAPDGTFSYTPLRDFSGYDSFLYRASDGASQSNLQRAFVYVTPFAQKNDPPLFSLGEGIHRPAAPGGGSSVAIQPDGKIVVGITAAGNTGLEIGVNRFNSDGSYDASFSGDGKALATRIGTTDRAVDVLVQPDGKIIVAGAAGNAFAIDRYTASGSPDPTFGTAGRTTTSLGTTSATLENIALAPDGKIVAIGRTNAGMGVVRYNPNGTLDTTFGGGDGTVLTGHGEVARGVAVQPDGKIVLSGRVDTLLFGLGFGSIRLNVDGTLDRTYNADGRQAFTIPNGSAESILTLPDGKILLGGWMNDNIFQDRFIAVARLNSDGTSDSTFNNGRGFTSWVSRSPLGINDQSFTMAMQRDGKILVAGDTFIDQQYKFVVVRFNPDGTLDRSFDGDGGLYLPMNNFNGEDARNIAVQPDGKIVISGGQDNAAVQNGVVTINATLQLVRLNADGSPDASFGAPVYAKNGAPVALNEMMRVSDPELAFQGHYEGASLTLARNGAANASDVFSLSGAPLLEGTARAAYTVTTNHGGVLRIDFNSKATEATVNNIIGGITYANTADALPSSVQIDWIFSDGSVNSAQGAGGAYDARTGTIVRFAGAGGPAVQDALILTGDAGNNALIGGAGNDRLTGGGGADRFVFKSVYDGVDTITDFSFADLGVVGDALDISSVLTSYGIPGVDLSELVQLTRTGAGGSVLSVNPDGIGDDFVPLATLNSSTFLPLETLVGTGVLIVT